MTGVQTCALPISAFSFTYLSISRLNWALWVLSLEKGEGGIPFNPPPFCGGVGALATVALTEAIGIVIVKDGRGDAGDASTRIGSTSPPGDVAPDGGGASDGGTASGRI